jgi:hypothetical protein
MHRIGQANNEPVDRRGLGAPLGGIVNRMADDPARLASFFAKANAVVRPLLKSPLHGLLSGRLMLLSYVGGKTGNEYTFAIGYFPWDDGDVLVSSTANWPKVLSSARNVRLLIKRKWFSAAPAVVRGVDEKVDILGEFARRNGPKAAKGLMLGLPGDRQPDQQELLAAAAKTTLVRFTFT